MNFLAYYPVRIHASHRPPCWFFDDDCFDECPISSRWRRPTSWDPFFDFHRTLPPVEREHSCSRKSTPAPDAADEKKFSHSFDLSGFEPKDIKVKAIGQKIVVEAETEENDHAKGCQSFRRRQFRSHVMLPNNVVANEFRTTLNDQGVLCVTAPLLYNDETVKAKTVDKEEKVSDVTLPNENY